VKLIHGMIVVSFNWHLIQYCGRLRDTPAILSPSLIQIMKAGVANLNT
jgi:hypothetical protein